MRGGNSKLVFFRTQRKVYMPSRQKKSPQVEVCTLERVQVSPLLIRCTPALSLYFELQEGVNFKLSVLFGKRELVHEAKEFM